MATTPQWDDSVTTWDEADTFWDVSRPVVQDLPVNPNTIYIAFNPSSSSNFVFQCTLDGANYVVVVTWNLFGERYYINLYNTQQKLILCTAVVPSPNTFNISLTGSMFSDLLVYREASGNFEIIPPT
jgi:hypothetical protein